MLKANTIHRAETKYISFINDNDRSNAKRLVNIIQSHHHHHNKERTPFNLQMYLLFIPTILSCFLFVFIFGPTTDAINKLLFFCYLSTKSPLN